jgi:hypothetical protein
LEEEEEEEGEPAAEAAAAAAAEEEAEAEEERRATAQRALVVSRRTDSYAAAFNKDLEACSASAAPVSVLGQAIGVLVGGGWSGEVWDEV